MTKDYSYKYGVILQQESAIDVNLAKDEIGEKVGLYRVYALWDDSVRTRLMSGEIVFMIYHKSNPDKVYMVVLTTKLTGRIPTMMFPSQMETDAVINKYNSEINQMFIQTNLGDRREYAHLTIGVPDAMEAH